MTNMRTHAEVEILVRDAHFRGMRKGAEAERAATMHDLEDIFGNQIVSSCICGRKPHVRDIQVLFGEFISRMKRRALGDE